ncbi:MAG TPA: nitroreductase/quinone reductase family protein [Candidatus Dormibacteraeota bacterium]|nr:nitroreductase/quinone reductase family protein [Candidatus Dormibacteraeota bacterium]
MKHLTLGPGARNAIRLVAQVVNPLTLLVAGRSWMRVVGVIRHRGRKTGRVYATPLGMRRLGDSFVMPLTFGEGAGWFRNISASGSGEVTYMGHDYTLTSPEVIDYEAAAPAFPRYELFQFRLIGIAQYLRMRIVQPRPFAASAWHHA